MRVTPPPCSNSSSKPKNNNNNGGRGSLPTKARKSLKVATWNVRSLGNKFSSVAQEIIDSEIDRLAVTESWQSNSSDVQVLRAAPPGYRFFDAPRPTAAGDVNTVNHGGIVLYFRENLVAKRLDVAGNSSSFESLCVSFSTPSGAFTVAVIYRPPGACATFHQEFGVFLETLATYNSEIVITGDLNIHFENNSDPSTVQIQQLLGSCTFVQHINTPTHSLGGVLDVVITRSDCNIQDIQVNPPTISDHGIVTCSIPFASQASPVYTTKLVRGWKKLDRDVFRKEIESGPLCADPESYDDMTASQLFDLYNDTFQSLLDRFVPLRKTSTRHQLSTPWFDDECRTIKRDVRRLENRFRRTREPADRLAWINAARDKHFRFRDKENTFWEDKIAAASTNPKKLWQSVSTLLGKSTIDRSCSIDFIIYSFRFSSVLGGQGGFCEA